MKPFWEKEYLNKNKFAFGAPSVEVKLYSELLPKGSKILDLGCGDGRNALYLAKQGFEVDCVDISQNGIDKINMLATKSNLKINTFLCDVTEFEYTCNYDMIIAYGLLQFINKQHQQSVIDDMKKHTTNNGYNIISVFTDELPIPDDLKDIMIGTFKKGELKKYYSNWKIKSFKSRKFHDRHEGGIKHYHASSKIVAQKKVDFDKIIIDLINDIENEKSRTLALNFVDFLSDNGMLFEKAGGYWENQQYFYVKYKNEFVCYILINGKDDEAKFYPFTVWSDDSNSNWYCNNSIDEHNRSIAIKHIDICEKCGACKGGTKKQIFGNQYDNVCRTTFRFINPDADELECLKKLVLLRKMDIDIV